MNSILPHQIQQTLDNALIHKKDLQKHISQVHADLLLDLHPANEARLQTDLSSVIRQHTRISATCAFLEAYLLEARLKTEDLSTPPLDQLVQYEQTRLDRITQYKEHKAWLNEISILSKCLDHLLTVLAATTAVDPSPQELATIIHDAFALTRAAYDKHPELK